MIDYAAVIERQTRDLLTVIASLFAYAGVKDGEAAATVTRRIYRYMLTILRPAESAMRRLIIIAARSIVLKARTRGAFPGGLAAKLKTLEKASRIAAFVLTDPLKQFFLPGGRKPFQPRPSSFPRISVPGWSTPYFPPPYVPPTGDDPVNAAPLFSRLAALKHALETLPKQARRLARWRAKRALARQSRALSKPDYPQLRRGRPPGYRKRHTHLVDRILQDCHYFAREAMEGPDTS